MGRTRSATRSTAASAADWLPERQPSAIGSTGTQRHEAEVQFQQPDLLAERRLGDVQPLGCPPEVRFLGDDDESGKVT